MLGRPALVCFFALCCAPVGAAWTQRAAAEGALAIGITGDIAKDGYSIGIAYNSGTEQQAKDVALEHCKTHGGPLSEAKCEIIVTFKDMCVAEAEDPQAGTPGAGWAVGVDKTAAEKMAMTSCLATAGKSRMQYCKIASSVCDGKQ
jgi:hypothetical protein